MRRAPRERCQSYPSSSPRERRAYASAGADKKEVRPHLSVQPEEPLGVAAADLQAVGLADRAGVEPDCRMVDVLERPVGREHDAVGADLEHRVDQALGAEIARGGEVEVLLEIDAQLLLRRVARRRLGPGVAIVDAPDAV